MLYLFKNAKKRKKESYSSTPQKNMNKEPRQWLFFFFFHFTATPPPFESTHATHNLIEELLAMSVDPLAKNHTHKKPFWEREREREDWIPFY